LFDLSDKVAIVTGASKGIGKACALQLADSGADVILVARNKERLDLVASRIRALGRNAYILDCDVTDVSLFRKLLKDFPVPSILVNNAGINIPLSITNVTEEIFDDIMGVNVRAAYFVVQAVVDQLIDKQMRGSIINISSQMGHIGAPNRSVYCTSKHALEGLTKSIALELAPLGIRANCVAPTFIKTEMTKPFLSDKAFKRNVLENIPLGRVGEVEDVIGAVLFLASESSSMVTGSSIKVDGGWTAH